LDSSVTTFRLVDEVGPVLTGRMPGEQLRRRIEQAAAEGPVVIDFAGVELMAPSFADEVFGKMPPHLVGNGRVQNANLHDELEALVRFAVSNRTP
jgi:hypothetical protein